MMMMAVLLLMNVMMRICGDNKDAADENVQCVHATVFNRDDLKSVKSDYVKRKVLESDS